MKAFSLIILFQFPFLIVFSQDCLCGEDDFTSTGGDKPTFTYTFSDSSAIAFCGGIPETILGNTFYISEFSVFICGQQQSIASYSAIHYCKVIMSQDSVFIRRIVRTYNGPGKEWKPIPISQRVIHTTKEEVKVTQEEVFFSPPDISLVDEESVFSADYEHMNYEEISDFLGKLEILALNQHPEAVKLLFSEKLANVRHGASAEHLAEIKAVYNWIMKGEKKGHYWW
ncbi:MAG: hypothetical protein AAGI38_05725 [Bacteroidota bacterium]